MITKLDLVEDAEAKMIIFQMTQIQISGPSNDERQYGLSQGNIAGNI